MLLLLILTHQGSTIVAISCNKTISAFHTHFWLHLTFLVRLQSHACKWLLPITQILSIILGCFFSLEFPLESLQLPLKTVIRVDKVSCLFDKLRGLNQGHSVVIHQVSYRDGSTPRHTCKTMNEDRTSRSYGFSDKLNAGLEMHFQICSWTVQNTHHFVVKLTGKLRHDSHSYRQYVSYPVLFQ
jgi:hypothetical protein